MATANDVVWMGRALSLAARAAQENEVPVGALLVRDQKVLGEGWNHPIGACDPTAHAEIQALRAASAREKNYRLPGATLYVTIEPCTMCLGALIHARIARVVFGACEPKAGVLQSNPILEQAHFYNHSLTWEGGVCEQACAELMQNFFSRRRDLKKQLKNKPHSD